MQKQIIFIGIGALLLVGALGVRVYQANQPVQGLGQEYHEPRTSIKERLSTPTIPLEPFLDPKTYAQDQRRARALESTWPEVACASLVGGVVNHHALAGDLIGAFFTRVVRCHPRVRTFIVLSPDHYRVGKTPVTLGSLNYTIGANTVFVDTAMLARATSTLTGVAVDDGTVFGNEHGVGALLAYAAPLAPGVRVLPITVDASIQEQDAHTLSTWLAREQARGDVFVIVSSDMSHYLHKEVAYAKDVTTKQMLIDGRDDWFWKATDAYTDNGRGIAVAVRALGDVHWSLWEEGISTDYKGEGGFTTSYLIGGWLR